MSYYTSSLSFFHPVSLGANGEGPDHAFIPLLDIMHGDGIHIPTNLKELDGYCCALFQTIFDNLPSFVQTPVEVLQNQLDWVSVPLSRC